MHGEGHQQSRDRTIIECIWRPARLGPPSATVATRRRRSHAGIHLDLFESGDICRAIPLVEFVRRFEKALGPRRVVRKSAGMLSRVRK